MEAEAQALYRYVRLGWDTDPSGVPLSSPGDFSGTRPGEISGTGHHVAPALVLARTWVPTGVAAALVTLRVEVDVVLEADGAKMAIARRTTHRAPAGVVGGYVRVQRADVCREVAKLRIELRSGAEVIPIRMAAGAPDSVTRTVTIEGAVSIRSEETGPGELRMLDSNQREARELQGIVGDRCSAHDPQRPPRMPTQGITGTQSVTHVTDRALLVEAASVLREAGREDLAAAVEVWLDERREA